MEKENSDISSSEENGDDYGFCAICLEKMILVETALVKGCDHAYCVTCILRWASYKKNPTCPQCKNSFESLLVHRSLDGCIHDYMLEESVCLLLRASWFQPLLVDIQEDLLEELDDFPSQYHFEEDEDDFEERYVNCSNFRISNRRWGDNGYIRGGRKEARPIIKAQYCNSNASSSTETSKVAIGRRAKRTQKREAADKANAAKHEKHLERLGRK